MRSFEEFFEQHRDAVFSWALRQVKDKEAAEWVTINTFTDAWYEWEHLPDNAEEALLAWLGQLSQAAAESELRNWIASYYYDGPAN